MGDIDGSPEGVTQVMLVRSLLSKFPEGARYVGVLEVKDSEVRAKEEFWMKPVYIAKGGDLENMLETASAVIAKRLGWFPGSKDYSIRRKKLNETTYGVVLVRNQERGQGM